jgi:hypothetical protein
MKKLTQAYSNCTGFFNVTDIGVCIMTLKSHVFGMGFVTVINGVSMTVYDCVVAHCRFMVYITRLAANNSSIDREFGSSACAGNTLQKIHNLCTASRIWHSSTDREFAWLFCICCTHTSTNPLKLDSGAQQLHGFFHGYQQI